MIITAKAQSAEDISPVRFEVYKEVEMTSTADKKVMVKQLVGEYTQSEIEADIANLENQIQDLTNQKRDKEALLAEINSL